jgi:hypothetical protein
MDEGTCDVCGARLDPGAEWCGLCLARTDHRNLGRSGPAGATPSLPLWHPESPLPSERYSRWRGGSTTFGPVGRIVATVVVVGLSISGFLVVRAAQFLGLTGWLAYDAVGLVILREVWKRDRIS